MLGFSIDRPLDASAVPGAGAMDQTNRNADGAPGERDPLVVGVRRSLRTKAWLAGLAMLLYVLGALAYVAAERSRVQQSVEGLQAVSAHEKALALAATALDGALVDVSEASNAASAGDGSSLQELALYMETCERLFADLSPFDPAYDRLFRSLQRGYEALKAQPARLHWIELREAMGRVVAELDLRQRTLGTRREALTHDFERRYHAVTTRSLLLALVGMTGFGALGAWFFSRLAQDLRRLEHHARTIVHGTRGRALTTTRSDEVGSLMRAVDRISKDLDDREKQLEVEHQRRAHQDKMSAVGALAAGVAHEVNNPLAIIAGVAQELASGPPGDGGGVEERARMILLQTERAAQAARHLSDLAQPQAAAHDWVDLNALVQRAVQMMRYDRRYRAMRFECLLARDVPAVHASADALQHAVMRMLALAADAALATGATGCDAQARTRVTDDGGHVLVEVVFPTKIDFADAAVQRALLLIRSVVEGMRGRLAVHRDAALPMLGLTLELPLGDPAQPAVPQPHDPHE